MSKVRWTCAHCGLLLEVEGSQQRAPLSCPKCTGVSVPDECIAVNDTSGDQLDLGKLGFILGEFVIRTANQYAPQMEQLISGDKVAVRLNATILVAWIASKRVIQSLPADLGRKTADCMHMRLLYTVRGSGVTLGLDEIQDLVANRYNGYYQAQQVSDGSPKMLHIKNYFLASAGHFEFVDFNKIVPNLEELSQLGSEIPGLVNPRAVEGLRELQRNQRLFTYPLTGIVKFSGHFTELFSATLDEIPKLIVAFLDSGPQ